MLKTLRIVIAVLFLLLPQFTHAIDKGFFGNLKPETAEQVLMSFWAPVYYVVSEKHGNLVTSLDKPKPFASHTYKYVIYVFLDKNEALSYQQGLQKQFPERLKILDTNFNRLMVSLYNMRNEPPSEDRTKPDMVIIDTLRPMIPVVEIYVDDQQRPYVHEVGGKKFIPAFMSREGAIEFESLINKSQKAKLIRRGVDFRGHLKFVEQYINTNTPVVTFADQVSRCMGLYLQGRR
jgi:hypothetical protein